MGQEENCWLQWISYGMSDVSSLFSRCIFPLWRCSQTAATNGSVNLHCVRQSPEYMISNQVGEVGRWIFRCILFLCTCLHFVNVPLNRAIFLGCAQLIMRHKQSFQRTKWINFVNIQGLLTLQMLSDSILKYTNKTVNLHSNFRISEEYRAWIFN